MAEGKEWLSIKNYSVCEVAKTNNRKDVSYFVLIAFAGNKMREVVIDYGSDKELAEKTAGFLHQAKSIVIR